MAEPDPRLSELIAVAWADWQPFKGSGRGRWEHIASVLQEQVVFRDDLEQIGVAHPTRSKWGWRVHSSADDCTHDPETLWPVFVLRDQEGTTE